MPRGQSENQPTWRVGLLPAFRCVRDERTVPLPAAPSALIVAVAIAEPGVARRALQARLWPDLPPEAAARRLRQLLWRARRATGTGLFEVTPDAVRLAADVAVDLREGTALARRVLSGERPPPASCALLGRSLLREGPDCGTVQAERDRWDRLRIVALERLAEHRLGAGDALGALELAGRAAEVDELAEAPHRIMALAHLARNDDASACRLYVDYRRRVARELHIQPSGAFRDLLYPSGIGRSGG
ncbi:AfsR/SARP family transcriptional regulator [Actinomadura flavalba]|uniref:AfsR/SARP family transcriptional regulator n=1 Tax=Actinomadura flavalba TaxID=1120938 RepID=UPI00036C5470|nr:BTAD domain-containing putative transcriptional regulator [Actinomadura flavalba]